MSELQGLQSRISEFEDAGIRVVAVSPESIELNRGVVEEHELEFPVLSDPDLEATRAFGLVHEGASMEGTDIPRPATYLLEGDVVVWRHLTDNWRVRIRAADLLAAVTAPGVGR